MDMDGKFYIHGKPGEGVLRSVSKRGWRSWLIAATMTLRWFFSYDLLARWPKSWSLLVRTKLEAAEHPVVLLDRVNTPLVKSALPVMTDDGIIIREPSRKVSKGGRGCSVEWSGNGSISLTSLLGNLGSVRSSVG